MSETVTYRARDPESGTGLDIAVKAGVITEIRRNEDRERPYVAPGLVDLQVNGFQGFDLNHGVLEPETVAGLSEALCRAGVAIYLPTLITASTDEICQRLEVIARARETDPTSRQMIAGVHVEGPSLSPLDGPRGAHPKDHIRPPSIEEFDQWQAASGGLVKMITLAPESDGAPAFVRHVTSEGVIVALGHSAADEEEIRDAVRAGATMSTHLGNGIAASLPRHPNAIWAQLAEDLLWASFVADGHHLPRSALIAMIRAKGIERSILVSDSVVFAGMAPGRYRSPIGGEVDVSDDGRVSVAGTHYLAGSGSSLLEIFCRFPAFTGLAISVAVTMTSHNPAHLLGCDVGVIQGASANFILFDHDETPDNVVIRDIVFHGKCVSQ